MNDGQLGLGRRIAAVVIKIADESRRLDVGEGADSREALWITLLSQNVIISLASGG